MEELDGLPPDARLEPSDARDARQAAGDELERRGRVTEEHVGDEVNWSEDHVHVDDVFERCKRFGYRRDVVIALDSQPEVDAVAGGFPIEDRRDPDDLPVDHAPDPGGDRLLS